MDICWYCWPLYNICKLKLRKPLKGNLKIIQLYCWFFFFNICRDFSLNLPALLQCLKFERTTKEICECLIPIYTQIYHHRKGAKDYRKSFDILVEKAAALIVMKESSRVNILLWKWSLFSFELIYGSWFYFVNFVMLPIIEFRSSLRSCFHILFIIRVWFYGV